jgi:AraC-like DNA-binding protein
MRLVAAPRSPVLAPFVSSLSHHQGALPAGRERVLPNGTMTLMVNLDQDEFRTYHGSGAGEVRRAGGAVLGGAEARAVVIDTEEQRCGMAVEFRFGGAAPFFAVPFGETTNRLVDLADLWGRDGAVLRERLLETRSPRRRLAVLERALLGHLDGFARPDPAIGHAVAALERGRLVREVCDDLGLLPRRFTRRFRDRTGLTPKLFARVRRLQRVVAAVEPGHPADWATIAADHGYCDQAHLIDDFRDIAGITPGAYRPRSAGERNHLPLP